MNASCHTILAALATVMAALAAGHVAGASGGDALDVWNNVYDSILEQRILYGQVHLQVIDELAQRLLVKAGYTDHVHS